LTMSIRRLRSTRRTKRCNARLELCLWDLDGNYVISLGGKKKSIAKYW